MRTSVLSILPASLRASFLILSIAGLSSPSMAQGGDVLVWSTGDSQSSVNSVASYLAASGYFDSVTGLDDDNTLSQRQLLAYDMVLYYSNASRNQDPVAIGDRLADYADTGRRLVLATFSWSNQGNNSLAGRVISAEISPFVLEGTSLYRSVSLAGHDGSQLVDDVASVTGFYHDDVRLTTSAVAHATWDDGEVLVASKENVVAINLWPTGSQASGDWQELFANALRRLSLETNTSSVNVGDTLEFRTARGQPGGLVMLAAVEVNGLPIFANLNVGLFDSDSERRLPFTVPSGLSGNAVTFLSLGLAKSGDAEATNRAVVIFN